MSLATPLEAPATVVRNIRAHHCPDRCGMLSRVVDGRLVALEKVAAEPAPPGILGDG